MRRLLSELMDFEEVKRGRLYEEMHDGRGLLLGQTGLLFSSGMGEPRRPRRRRQRGTGRARDAVATGTTLA